MQTQHAIVSINEKPIKATVLVHGSLNVLKAFVLDISTTYRPILLMLHKQYLPLYIKYLTCDAGIYSHKHTKYKDHN